MVATIFFQFKKRRIADSRVDAPCPSCGSTGTVQMLVAQKYSTVFFIPYAPMGQEAVAHCHNCGATFNKKTFTESLKQSYNKITKRPPLWMYIGSGLSAAFMVFVVWLIVHMQRENERMALQPETGNVYDVRINDKVFTLFKVTAVKGDSIYLVQNQYTAGDYSGFDQLRDKPYQAEAHAVHKKQIKEWYDSGFIRNVHPD